ncbi:hypothetical protein H9W95_03630 [Flavobacterium lindanitolerans]|nr:hypothetical protein [Flavobacterium lindanitolerans]
MTKNSTSAFKVLSLLFLFSIPTVGFSQDKNDIQQITKDYDLKKLKELEEIYRKKAASQKRQALKAAKLNNWPEFIKNENGTVDELIKLTPDGFPLYYSVDNRSAARSTRTNFLNTGGALD